MDPFSIDLEQSGESPELEKIKKKVFGRSFKFPSTPIKKLSKFEKEKNLHTFMGMKEELMKDNIIE